MADNIISMPTPKNILADRIRAAYGRAQHGRQEWIEGTLQLAAALKEARDQYTDNRSFSHWLVEIEFQSINDDDRAALINMAADLALARLVLQETMRVSWRHIWLEEMQPRVRHVANSELPDQIVAEPASSAEPETKSPDKPEPAAARTKPVHKRSPFYDWPRAAEVAAIYHDDDTRGAIGKVINGKGARKASGGKDIWSLILAAIDHGFLTETKMAISKVTLRILFPGAPPNYCKRFDLTSPQVRQHVRDHIMVAALENRGAVIAAPAQLEDIVAQHWKQHKQAEQKVVAEQKMVAALGTMLPGQTRIVMYGVVLWPQIDESTSYEYDQLCAAIWYLRDFTAWAESSRAANSPKSLAVMARFSVRWFGEYVTRAYDFENGRKIKRVFSLVHMLAGLLEQKPDGECIRPISPHVEGEW